MLWFCRGCLKVSIQGPRCRKILWICKYGIYSVLRLISKLEKMEKLSESRKIAMNELTLRAWSMGDGLPDLHALYTVCSTLAELTGLQQVFHETLPALSTTEWLIPLNLFWYNIPDQGTVRLGQWQQGTSQGGRWQVRWHVRRRCGDEQLCREQARRERGLSATWEWSGGLHKQGVERAVLYKEATLKSLTLSYRSDSS